MSLDYINEAFRSLESLNEELFNTDSESLHELSDFIDPANTEDEKISIIDMEAETEDELQDNYVGKIICDCNICHSYIFKNRDEIEIDDEGVVDIDEECPMCGEQGGFVIIGEIHEFNPNAEGEVEETPESEDVAETDEVEEVEEVSEEPAEEITESLNESPRKFKPHTMKLLKMIGSDLVNDAVEEKLEESFNNVSIETDDQKMTMTSEENGKVTVTTEPVVSDIDDAAGEVIAPISDEEKDSIIDATAEVETEVEPFEDAPADADVSETEEELDFDIDEVDEESMDELGESYMKRVYENVDSFKTTNISTTPNQLIIEGLITFKSGAQKTTGFIFESKDATNDGKVRFIGENAHFSRGRKAFTLNGTINENKLIMESFTYNYRAKGADGKSTRVYGTVSRNK